MPSDPSRAESRVNIPYDRGEKEYTVGWKICHISYEQSRLPVTFLTINKLAGSRRRHGFDDNSATQSIIFLCHRQTVPRPFRVMCYSANLYIMSFIHVYLIVFIHCRFATLALRNLYSSTNSQV